MGMTRCQSGHFFNDEQHRSCPFCGVNVDIGKTRGAPGASAPPPLDSGSGETRAVNPAAGGGTVPSGAADEPTRNRGGGGAKKPGGLRDGGATIGLMQKKMGTDPVVGWLICVKGADKGRDFRIHAERNFIGRDPDMDIVIGGDNGVSRKNHAVISYNPKKHTFRIAPGDSRGLVYLNDDEVAIPTDLAPYDRIEMGDTLLMFVPLCGEVFNWEQQNKPDE